MPNQSFDLTGPVGRLEAILMEPEGETRAAAVVCHAHPLHGGMMHFKVIFRVAKALQEQGVAALRFNFRGVGLSAGVHDHGRGEQDDARSGLDELARRFPGRPLLIAGFSFGANVALRVAAADTRVQAVASLGLPIAHIDDLTFLRALRKPRLFVQGGNDEFGAADAIRALVDPLPEPKRLVIIEGADHFLSGRLDEVHATVADWATAQPWPPR
jgi:alpha/beta superfamily hydrolase